MATPFARTVRKLKQAFSQQLPKRRDDSGLTTLEWLLIVAAVAGLAALAVVLVQRVVSDTSEQIAGSSARETAARVAAQSIVQEAKNSGITNTRWDTAAKWDNYFTDKCNRIAITFSDAGITAMTANFDAVAGFTVAALLAADDMAATATKAQAQCEVP